MYKYEIHLHTSGCSACAVSSVEDMVAAAKLHGYRGIVITNHFYRGNTGVDRRLSWNEFVGAYEREWLRGKAFGETTGVDVIFGIEEVYSKGKEVLIYGITPDELKAETDFNHYDLEKISGFVRRHNGFLSHAHPFRARPYIPEPGKEPDARFLDGVEVNNANDPEERNKAAEIFAVKHGLRFTSGGDIHSADSSNFGTSGIAVEERIKDTKTLAKVLHSGKYRIIVNGKIV